MSVESYEAIINAVSDEDVDTAIKEIRKALDSSDSLETLRSTYESTGISVVLGAGVSVSCGAPSWNELLLRLHNLATSRQWSVDLSGLSELYSESVAADGPLISARLAVPGVDDQSDDFRSKLRDEIYRGVAADKRSSLVEELARLAQCCEGVAGVTSVLTYNYDVLLEEEFDHLGRAYRRLDRNETGSLHGIEIRHVHGFLGRARLDHEWVVLTERAYHSEYALPFSWSNVVQLNSFRESVCLFVGLSMTDPNLRRLLEAARHSATPTHFCVLRRTSGVALENAWGATWETRGRGKGRPSAEQGEQVAKRFELTALMVDANRAAALKELGVRAIYYGEHSELPRLIRSIRGGAGSA
jgi:hypothetical protein